MTGVNARPRGRYKIWFIADHAAGYALAPRSIVPLILRRPGQWLGWYYRDDPVGPTENGVRWWATHGRQLIASNHPHWTGRIGYEFDAGNLP